MNCNCKYTETILGIVILVFVWVDFYSKWIITIAAALLIIHALTCKNCGACQTCMPDAKSTKPVKKKKK